MTVTVVVMFYTRDLMLSTNICGWTTPLHDTVYSIKMAAVISDLLVAFLTTITS